MTNTNNFPYLPHTDSQRQEMLKAIGVSNFDELIKHIPKNVRINDLDILSGMNELELRSHIESLAFKNKPTSGQTSFLGGGSYRRFVPAAVSSLVSRSEFATAYTPYQPEVSQGSLQAIYEFQTAICLLTGMDVANASMYDGPTAAAEAALMACRVTTRNKIVLAESLNPEYKDVIQTYLKHCGIELAVAPATSGNVEEAQLKIENDVAAFIVQSPNYFGCLENLSQIEKVVHKNSALLIVVTEPISLGLLKPPSEYNADIVVGDAQPCGNNLSFGGPSAGYMACRQEFIRQLPGRIAGMTIDNRGQRAFTLTLQTREQHIRRAKATSNICTNQALNALTMLVYLTLLGPIGIRELADIGVKRAHYLQEKLCAIQNVKLVFQKPFFNEFAIETPLLAGEVLAKLRENNILGGVDLSKFNPLFSKGILIAVTEMNAKADMEKYIEVLADIIGKSHNTAKRSNIANEQLV